jgi:hypothetical protein
MFSFICLVWGQLHYFLWDIYPCPISDMDLTNFENDFGSKQFPLLRKESFVIKRPTYILTAQLVFGCM